MQPSSLGQLFLNPGNTGVIAPFAYNDTPTFSALGRAVEVLILLKHFWLKEHYVKNATDDCFSHPTVITHTFIIAANFIAVASPTNEEVTAMAKSFMDIFAPLKHLAATFLNKMIFPVVYFGDNRN